jgi:hypothetical protein
MTTKLKRWPKLSWIRLSIDCWTKLQKWYLGKTRCYCKNILNVTCVITCNPVCNIFVLFFFVVQFFTMHETLHTYLFWAFGEKTPSLLFMLREEKSLYITTMSIVLRWRISSFVKTFSEAILRRWRLCLLVTTRFSLFQSILPKINIVSPCDHNFHSFESYFRRSILCPLLVPYATWCMMLMLCKMMWWCYVT